MSYNLDIRTLQMAYEYTHGKTLQQIGDSYGLTRERVHNWMTRGIPYKVKFEHPELFSTQNRRAGDPAKATGGAA